MEKRLEPVETVAFAYNRQEPVNPTLARLPYGDTSIAVERRISVTSYDAPAEPVLS